MAAEKHENAESVAERVESGSLETPPTFRDLTRERSPSENVTDPRPLLLEDMDAERIGPYRLTRRIGEGGMGTVFEADQLEPVRRRVALKLIKWGMDTKTFVARFESERQALALMNHPNIAAVYDAGATEKGRPYFVMEYVEGEPITSYCDRHRLSVDERLALMLAVCEGVQHAHQKGVVHRDIKPSNILVSSLSDKAVPKLIDFGIAKAISQRLTEKTFATELGQLVGTPEYMSPEQADMTGVDIDTRTDVYSLGVVLYELLTGTLPFESSKLRPVGLEEMRRTLREQEPPRVSTRVATLGEKAHGVAENRRTDPRALARKLKGDLDWIVLKAMEKDRARRYPSPSELASDITRYLRHEALVASPPSTVYRARKFVRRHRLGVAAAALVLVTLLIGVVGTTLGLVRAQRSERKATAEAAKAKAINAFLQEALGAANPQEGMGRDATVLEALAEATRKIGPSFKDQPDVEAAVRSNVGLTYLRLGRYEEAEPLFESALEMQRQLFGPKSLEVAESIDRMAGLRFEQGNPVQAEALYRDSLGLRRALLGPNHALVAESLDNLGLAVSHGRGDYAEAESLHREALAMRRRLFGDRNESVVRNMNNLAMALYRQEKYEEAEAMFRRAVELNRDLTGTEDLAITLLNNLGLVLRDTRRYQEASKAMDEALRGTRELLGDSHPRVVEQLNNLARLQMLMGEYALAEQTHREAIALAKRIFGRDHFTTATAKSHLGASLTTQRRFEEAEGILLEAYEVIGRYFPDAHPRTQATIRRLITLYENWNRPEQAERFRKKLKE